MKKFLFLLLAVILPMAICAQLLDNNREFQRAPYALKTFQKHQMTTPSRIDLAANQLIMGHYTTDDVASSNEGIGFTSAGTKQLGTIITPEEVAVFNGGKIVKFRVGLANAANITKVLVARVTIAGAVSTLKSYTCNTNAAGWNEITLSSPYDISLSTGQGLLIGFEYKQVSGQYPLSAVQVGDIYPTLLKGSLSWSEVSGFDAYGNLSVQCVVESDNFPEYLINVSSLNLKKMIKLGDDITFSFNTKNLGIGEEIAAGACTYDVFIDGELVTTISNPQAFGKNALTIEGTIPSTGLTAGNHNFTVVVNSLNGEPIENPTSISKDFKIFVNGFARQMHLVEQFTSTGCTWCPVGSANLQNLCNMRDDVAWVGIHVLFGSPTDPFASQQNDTIDSYQGVDALPEGTFDRTVGIESADGLTAVLSGTSASTMSAFMDYIDDQSPSWATVNINSTFNEATREANITIDGELAPGFDGIMGEDAKLTVYITEDNLVAAQLNQGTIENNYVHNGVLRKALVSVKGVALNKNGDSYKNEFTYTIPTAWKADNLNVIAFISRPLNSGNYTDMYVNQANKRKLGEYDEPVTTLRGDVDGSGTVGMDDLTALINYLVYNDATGLDMEAANCDLIGGVGMDDLTALINYLVFNTWND